MAGINIGRNLPDIRTGTQGGSAAGAAPRVTAPGTSLEQLAQQRPQGPQYFGYHTDASIAARLAQQGVPPNPVNLRVATEMLRYGVPLSGDMLNQMRQLWQGMGSSSLVDLEAVMALFSQGLDTDMANVQAMNQLLTGGPMSHLLAQLTMTLKNQPGSSAQLGEMKNLLNQFWKLGQGGERLGAELNQFQLNQKQLERTVMQLEGGRIPPELAANLDQIRDLLKAQRLLLQDPNNRIYVPFYEWRDQQPLPGELLVQVDESAQARAAGFAQVTLAIDTRNLGRIILDFTAIRGHLAVKVEVQDLTTKQLLERGLPDLRHRLTHRTPYQVATIQCLETAQNRSISVLLPRRRDARRLGRAIGVI